MGIDETTERIIAAGIAVHRELGPGLLESTYQACMAYELIQRALRFEREKPIPVVYRGVKLECSYRIDFLVEHEVIVEIKAVDRFDPVHTAQLLTYLKLSGCRVGLLMNFKVPLLKDGIRRLVLGLPESSR